MNIIMSGMLSFFCKNEEPGLTQSLISSIMQLICVKTHVNIHRKELSWKSLKPF